MDMQLWQACGMYQTVSLARTSISTANDLSPLSLGLRAVEQFSPRITWPDTCRRRTGLAIAVLVG